MTKFGRVSAYNQKTGMVTVVYARPDACEKCGACGGKSQSGRIELKADCKIGEWVRVELPDGRFLRATALAYAMPLGGLLLGLLLGYALSGGAEGWALAGSLIGLSCCVLALWLNEKRIANKPEWTPKIVAVYPEKPKLSDIGCGGAEE